MNNLGFVVAIVAIGCGGEERPEPRVPDSGTPSLSAGELNVAACEGYVASLDCGGFDFSTIYGEGFCDGYAETTCEIAEYFDCLTEGAECIDGVYSPALDCAVPVCDDPDRPSGSDCAVSGVAAANQASCDAFVAAAACGGDAEELFGEGYCDDFCIDSCDLTEYFGCLRDGMACEGANALLPDDCEVPAC